MFAHDGPRIIGYNLDGGVSRVLGVFRDEGASYEARVVARWVQSRRPPGSADRVRADGDGGPAACVVRRGVSSTREVKEVGIVGTSSRVVQRGRRTDGV